MYLLVEEYRLTDDERKELWTGLYILYNERNKILEKEITKND